MTVSKLFVTFFSNRYSKDDVQLPFNQNDCPDVLVVMQKVMALITQKDEVDEVMQPWMARPFRAKNDVVSFKGTVNPLATLAKQMAMLLNDLGLEDFFVFLKFCNAFLSFLTQLAERLFFLENLVMFLPTFHTAISVEAVERLERSATTLATGLRDFFCVLTHFALGLVFGFAV